MPELSLRFRRLCAVLLTLTLIAVGLIVLTPGAPAEQSQQSLHHFLDQMHAQGRLPAFMTFELVEGTANAVMFVPIGFLFAAVWPARRRLWVVGIVCGLSSAIELAQRWVPNRVSTLHDVLTNTIGGTIGLLLLLVLSRWRRLQP